MEVHLKNFRCWQTKSIKLSPNGITLLSGPSGAGKSSILEAILFAITGKGRNIVTQGKTSCEVKIILNDGMSICRKKRPNVVNVSIPGGNTYEDDAAQSVINNIFTTHFETIGYLGQNGRNNSFVLKSPSEKLAFIEQLAFHNIDIIELKNKAYELFKEQETNYNKVSTTVTILNEQLKDVVCHKVNFPIKTKDKEKAEIKIQTNLEKSETDKNKLTKLIESNQKTHQKAELLSSKINTYTERITVLESQIEELELLLPEDNCVEKLEILTSKINKKKSQEKLELLRQKISTKTVELSELKQIETTEMENILNNIVTWDKYSEEECELNIKSKKQEIMYKNKSDELYNKLESLDFDDNLIDDIETKLNDVNKQAEILKEQIRIGKLSQKVLICPDCNSNLQLVNGCLESSEHSKSDINIIECQEKLSTILTESKNLSKKLTKLKTRQQKYNDVVDEIENIPEIDEDVNLLNQQLKEIETYLIENTQLDKKRKDIQYKLDNNIFSKAVNELSDKLDKYKKHADKIKIEDEITESLDTLLNSKEKLQETVFKYKASKKQLSVLSEEFNELTDKISTLESKLPSQSSEKIIEKINKYKLKLDGVSEKIEKYTSQLKKIEHWKIYDEQRKKEEKLKCKYQDAVIKEKENSQMVAACATLRQKIKEAESICLQSFLQSIESEVQVYLDEFFPDDPLVLRLNTHKESKSKKKARPEVNISLHYKSRECDHNSLSGGELQRLILAFSLAFTERFNLPFVLLDECTSNLDAELTGEVVDAIKKYQHDRPILLVAHQVVSGMFEKVINI